MSGYGYHNQPSGYRYGAPPPGQPYSANPYAPAAAPYDAPYSKSSGHKPSSDPHSQSHGSGYPQSSAPPYSSPFALLVPSAFPSGTDPNVVACFQMADQDGSGFIDDMELQRALSSCNQSFSLRTVHLLMYNFTNTNTRKIGNSFSSSLSIFYSFV
ncbi:hypothetical protein L6164_009359 [Bauhinia variegata]|uniref:Uncharacterized protein n=1 Tax=Bauhinia variegata TaxID=167791 RepID=A0ACB9PMF0_BAUVA|nr:hypothetical protein L6164_009359 [Bauhinia variegata]